MKRILIASVFLVALMIGGVVLLVSYINLRHNYRVAVGQMLVCRDLASSVNNYLLEPEDKRNEHDYQELMGSYGKVCWMDGYNNWLSTLNMPFFRLTTAPLTEELIKHQIISEQSMN